MLQNLRDNSKGVVSGLLIGLLVVIFALTGAEALFNLDTTTSSAVEVNGTKISEQEIARAVALQKQQMLARYGDSIPAEFLTDEYLRGPVIENLIERKLLLQTARESGLAVSDQQLNEQILSTPQFRLEDGSFDSARYQMLLRNIDHTPSTYKAVLAEDAIITQLGAGIVNTSFVTQEEVNNIVALSFQSRTFDYALIPADKVQEKVVVSEADIQTFYDNNAQEFTNPEQVAVDYIELSVEKLMADNEVSEEDVRRQYEQNMAAFTVSPERHAAHILIESNDENVIAEVQQKLADGEDFAELARTYSDDLGSREQGGDLGVTTGNTFPEKFEEALATLSVGGVSEPVVTDAGTHFIKKLSERGIEPPSFEEERERLASQLKRSQAENEFVDLMEKLRDRSYNAENLGEVAQELGLEVNNTGFFARTGGSGVAASRSVIDAAFSAEVMDDNNSSDIIELSPSQVLVLKKTDVKPSYVSPLEEVSAQILTRLSEQKTRELLAQQAAELKQKINAGEAFDRVVTEAGLEIKKAEAVERNAPGIDGSILRHAFAMAKPQGDTPVIDSVATPDGNYALVALTAVTLGGERVSTEQKTMIVNQLAAIRGQSEYQGYQDLLRSNADIEQ